MKYKLVMSGLLAIALSALTANACIVQVRVACPGDRSAEGVKVCIDNEGCAYTDEFGIATIPVSGYGTHTVRVDESTLPEGAKLNPSKMNIKVLSDAPPVFNFELSGDFCSTNPPPGDCWLTGGGTVGKPTRGVPEFSFGGVVYPGCSPLAAGGGNWNVIDHTRGLHFLGKYINVTSCSGVPTQSPKVNVNIIDFNGVGTLKGVGGNPDALIPVTFEGRAVDNQESGSSSDLLYIKVLDGGSTVLQIGNSALDPAVISTGNLQIHTTGCNK